MKRTAFLALCSTSCLAACGADATATDATVTVTTPDATDTNAIATDTNATDATTPDATDTSCEGTALAVARAKGVLVVALDRSASMTGVERAEASRDGLHAAFADASFDALAVGVVAYPASMVAAPACYASTGVTEVGCGLAVQPTAAPAVLGAGGRSAVDAALATPARSADVSDGTPLYGALASAYVAARGAPADRAAVLVVSDGGASCASTASPPRGGFFDGYCDDWEDPVTTAALIHAAATDAQHPVDTFVIGVAGSATHGEVSGNFSTPPYATALALSVYAAAGTSDPPAGCDAALAFAVEAQDPGHPCHFDLASTAGEGGAAAAAAIADAVREVRAAAFACRFEVAVPSGETPTVVVPSGRGAGPITIRRRTNSADTCTDGCYDLVGHHLRLIGPACDPATDPTPTVTVGCE